MSLTRLLTRIASALSTRLRLTHVASDTINKLATQQTVKTLKESAQLLKSLHVRPFSGLPIFLYYDKLFGTTNCYYFMNIIGVAYKTQLETSHCVVSCQISQRLPHHLHTCSHPTAPAAMSVGIAKRRKKSKHSISFLKWSSPIPNIRSRESEIPVTSQRWYKPGYRGILTVYLLSKIK